MSTGLLEQLQIYGEDFDTGVTPVTLDDLENILLKPVGTGAVRPLQRRRSKSVLFSGWAYAFGAAAAVLLLVGGAAFVLRVLGGVGPATDASSSSWARVAHEESVFGGAGDQVMSSVAAGGPGLVAVGSDDSIGLGVSAVWTSPDGVAWSRVAHDGTVFGGPSWTGMNSVTAGGPGLVAVGYDISLARRNGAVWTSVDGITWSRVPLDPAVFGGAAINSVTAGGPGLVAVGQDDSGAAVWTSSEGMTWARVGQADAFHDQGEMFDVAAGGPGLVAVGRVGGGDGLDQDAAVWTSPDGITWSRVPHDEAIFGGNIVEMSSVTAGGPGLVAVGSQQSFGPGIPTPVWTSRDGITWSRVPRDGTVFLGAELASVTAGGPGLVAVGGAFPNAAAFTSVDGITWTRVRHDETVFGGEGNQWMRSVAVTGSRVVAVGRDRPFGEDADATVWTANE